MFSFLIFFVINKMYYLEIFIKNKNLNEFIYELYILN